MDDCEKYQELISLLIDGELSAEEESGLKTHMDSCSECRRLYSAFASLSCAVSAPLEEPPAELKAGVMTLIRSRKRHSRTGRFFKIAALAACLALIIAGAAKLASLSGEGADNRSLTASAEGMAPKAGSYEDSDAAKPGERQPDVSLTGGKGQDSGSSSNFAVLSGSDGDFKVSDKKILARLSDILAEGEKAESSQYSETNADAHIYTVTLPGEKALSVSVDGDKLVCVNSAGEAYLASGSAADFEQIISEVSLKK